MVLLFPAHAVIRDSVGFTLFTLGESLPKASYHRPRGLTCARAIDRDDIQMTMILHTFPKRIAHCREEFAAHIRECLAL